MIGRAVTLGKQQRALLLEAFDRPVALAQPDLSREAIRRRREAAAALERLGLAEIAIAQSPHSARLVKMITLTAIGRQLAHDFEDELHRGTRIRWAQRGWRASYSPLDDASAARVPAPANDVAPSQALRPTSRLWAALTIATATLLLRRAA